MLEKKCGRCNATKSITEFHINSSTKSGYSSYCKTCKSASDAAYRAANRNSLLKKKMAYYRNGGKEKLKQWYKNNPDNVKAKESKARAKRRSKENITNLPTIEFKHWLATQHLICVYCGIPCDTNYEIEHIVPLSKNGQHSIDNLAIACHKCNQSKSNKELIHWFAWKQNL